MKNAELILYREVCLSIRERHLKNGIRHFPGAVDGIFAQCVVEVKACYSSESTEGTYTGAFSESVFRGNYGMIFFFEVSTELLNLLINGLDGIEERLRDVEKAIVENKGRHSGLVKAVVDFICI